MAAISASGGSAARIRGGCGGGLAAPVVSSPGRPSAVDDDALAWLVMMPVASGLTNTSIWYCFAVPATMVPMVQMGTPPPGSSSSGQPEVERKVTPGGRLLRIDTSRASDGPLLRTSTV